ncbi:hypothetical protein ACT43R_02705 [Acinetobacter baumannii]|uniref:hypothetical protein n=1 Tax=Acinetobacter baumannii TaxID=470 RepID=UPI001C0CB04D|nr:hypothetical protein [Acinetobacter baumannii]MBU3096266.1 hypothetical protein [Acinetobacter baumannii]MDC4829525.1 hypothetical protein [Acinetobacter baumannii]
MRKNVLVCSIVVSAIIIFLMMTGIFWLIFFYWGNSSSFKDSISTASGLFSGFTTLGAAVIAAYLFNDWRETEDFKRSQYLSDCSYQTIQSTMLIIEELSSILYENQNMKNKDKIRELLDKIIRSTFAIITKIGMDYNASITKDQQLRALLKVIFLINKDALYFEENFDELSYKQFSAFHVKISKVLDDITNKNLKDFLQYLG